MSCMATTTTNLGLTKPDYTDAADIAVINTNMDTVDTAITATKSDLGIVEDGNTAIHSITKGQYVIWKGNLYTASSAIAIGTTLSTSNLTAVSNGGLNSLNDHIATKQDKGNSVTGSTLETIESSLNTIASSMTNASCIIGYAFPENWAYGSGCYVLSRRSSTVINVSFILATAIVNGYYYSSAWHWYKVELD